MAKIILGLSLFLGATPSAFAKCAVIFVPGAFASHSTASSLFLKPEDYFKPYIDAVKSWGCETKMAELPVDASIEEQGMALKEQIKNFSIQQVTRLVVIAHSQGALDAAYVLHDFKFDPYVEAMISIGAPFHGTPAAVWVMNQREHKSIYYWVLKWLASYDLATLSFAPELTPSFLEAHADHFARNEDIRYAYARGMCLKNCHLVLRFLSAIIDIDSGDGLIPLASQKPAYGEKLGDFDLDHISEVAPDSDGIAERGRLIEAIHGFIAQELK